MQSFSLNEIGAAIGADVFGDGEIRILAAAEPADAGVDDLALAMDPKYAEGLSSGAAQAAIVWEGADWQAMGLKGALVVSRPRYAMSGITQMLDPGPQIAPGIHPSAVIDPSQRSVPTQRLGRLSSSVKMCRSVPAQELHLMSALPKVPQSALTHCCIPARVSGAMLPFIAHVSLLIGCPRRNTSRPAAAVI